MNTYANQISTINDTIATLPKANSRTRRHFGQKRHAAGMNFLARIHDEVQTQHPEWRKDDDAPQSTHNVPISKLIELKVEAPQLTDDYLTHLGIPTTLASMSGKPTHGLEVLGGTNEEAEDIEEAA